jgi:predicted dehydrogenase
MSILSRPDRRDFLKAAAAVGLPAWFATELLAAEDPPKKAEDKPKIALIGSGGMGRGDARNAKRFGDVVAVCDVDANRAAEAAKEFGAKPYSDFRKLLEAEKGVSVVINGTPDHWHTLVNLAALKAGKDVYSEKPLTLTIDEGKRVVAAVKEHKRVLQTGSQQRSDARFRLACEIIRNGRLGKLATVTTVLPQGLNEGPFKAAPVPKELDWDAWQGPTAETEYVPQRCHFNFRYWTEYSGGTLTDWGAHHNDIALWAIGPERGGPESVEGQLLLKPVPGGFTAPAAYEATFTYPNGVVHKCISTTASTVTGGAAKGKPGEMPHGIKFEGADGWLFVTRGKIEASKPEILNDKFGDKDVRLPVSTDHMGNFFEAVKSRKQPICSAEVGHRSASICHLAGIAVKLGRKLKWDPVKEEFVGDKEANGLLAREQRKKWSYETI